MVKATLSFILSISYVEVLTFEKILSDAKKRNRILFEKLGIGQ